MKHRIALMGAALVAALVGLSNPNALAGPAVLSDPNVIADAAEKVTPSVVNISSTTKVSAGNSPFDDDPLSLIHI